MTVRDPLPDPGTMVDPADWATIWQSELAALATDREWQEGFAAWGQAWVTAGEPAAGRTGPDAPPGPAPVGAASGIEQSLEAVRRGLAEWQQHLGGT